MSMAGPKIAIGAPVRNRAWILPDYLQSLIRLEYENRIFLFLENDSSDDTTLILQEFCNGEPNRILKSASTGSAHWDHGDYAINQYENLAKIRNEFIEMFLKTDADYMLSIDSDVIVPPDILSRLMQHADERTIVGAAISNIPGHPLDGSTPGNFMIERNGMMVHPNPYPLSGLMNVDVIGAVYLIPRKALELGVQYAPHQQGEDIAFCISAREKGISMRVVMDLQCEHRMIKT